MESLKERTAKGLAWGGLSNGIQQLLNAVFGIFLARILSQYDYGMVGMLTIFSSVASSLQEGGFISALIRKKDISSQDYNAVFWTNTLLSVCFYLILFACAPLIARFYGIDELTPLARYTFLGFLIASLNIAPRAHLMRNMMVRETTIMSITSLVVSGLVGIAMAAMGFSYWGIATQTIVFNLCVTIMSYRLSGWRPSLSIDFTPVRNMFGFSSRLIITNIVNIVNNNIFSVLLGKLYTPNEVGDYTQANKWNNMGWSFVSNMLGGIAQPVFSKTIDDKERQKHIFRKLLRFTALVCFPTMFGLALVAQEFIVILLTEKWLTSAGMLQLLCIAGAFIPLSNLFSNLIISRGHSSVFMWSSIALCCLQLAAVCLSAPYGIRRMIEVYVIINIFWLFVWHLLARKEIDLKLREVLMDIAPYFILAVVLTVAAWMLTSGITNRYLSITVKVLFVGSLYCLSLWLLKSTIFKEIILFITKKEVPQ